MFPSMESNPVVTRGCQIADDHRVRVHVAVSKVQVKEVRRGRNGSDEGRTGEAD